MGFCHAFLSSMLGLMLLYLFSGFVISVFMIESLQQGK